MPLYYSFYRDLDPGLYRRLSYGEYTRRRYSRYRHLISRNNTIIPISIPDPILYRSSTEQSHDYNLLDRPHSNIISTFTQTFGLGPDLYSSEPDLYSSEPDLYTTGSRLSSGLYTTGSRLSSGLYTTGSTLENVLSKTKVKINKDKNQFCPICQDDVKTDTDIIRELECNHIYHIECIDKWLIIKNECPMCKNKI